MMRTRIALFTTLLLAGGWNVHCGEVDSEHDANGHSDSTDVGASQDSSEPTLSSVSYQLDWDWGAAVRTEGGGWSVTTDLGYRVTVLEGYLVNYSMSLVACSDMLSRVEPGERDIWDELNAFFGIQTAHAGHPDEVDPSAVDAPVVESLSEPGPSTLAEREFDAEAYCQLHYLVARADDTALELPASRDLLGLTLVLFGEVVSPTGAVQVLELEAPMAYASITDFADLPPASGEGEHATIVVRRSLEHLFDGVDFAALDDDEVGRQVLSNLVQFASVEIKLGAHSH